MRALQLIAWGELPEFREVAVPEPGPGQVLVRVAGAGACHSDLHLMELPAGIIPYDPPFTLGHETTGHVAALGAGVTGWAEGDAVAIYGPWGCGRCRACRQSFENYCEHASEIRGAGGGLGLDGGMAEYVLVPNAANCSSRSATSTRSRRHRSATRRSRRTTRSRGPALRSCRAPPPL